MRTKGSLFLDSIKKLRVTHNAYDFSITESNAKTTYPVIPTVTAITTENNQKKTAPVENVGRWHTKKWPSDARNSLLRAVFLFIVVNYI